jgi:tRNA nucleotidyltransferase (CCA-adding enzyme)
MKEYLKKLPQEIQELVNLAADIAAGNKVAAYLVGGFVRDLILRVKNLDLDIVVEADGIKFAEDIAKTKNARVIRHRRFGTATVVVNNCLKIDVTSARREIYPEPGSLPLVAPGSLSDDLARRDFTINAMAISIQGQDFGRLIDFFNGRNDIRERNIRVLHDASFIDDPTRMLRAIRFEQRYNFRIERHTLRLVQDAVFSRALAKVSPHRLRDELILALKEPFPVKCIRRMDKLVGFSFISPKLRLGKEAYSFLRSIDRQILWFRKKTPKKRALDAWLIYLIGLVGNMDRRDIITFVQRFGFSRGDTKRILCYKDSADKLAKKLKQKVTPSQAYKHLQPLSYEVILLLSAKYKNKILAGNISNFLNIYNGVTIHATGDDLAKLEVKPGPYYKSVLTKTLYAKLEGKVKTKKEEQEFIRGLVRRQAK